MIEVLGSLRVRMLHWALGKGRQGEGGRRGRDQKGELVAEEQRLKEGMSQSD